MLGQPVTPLAWTRAAPLAAVAAAGILLLAPSGARTESALRLPMPASFGETQADTYDGEGRRLGPALLRTERLEDRVRVWGSTGIEGGARTVFEAELVPRAGGRALQPLRQESRSFDMDGTPLGVMRIDHASAVASCARPSDDGEGNRSLPLPDADRVANGLLPMLLERLVREPAETRLEFQILTCRGEPRVLDAEGIVGDPGPGANGIPKALREVRYSLRMATPIARLVEPFLPHLSMWFDPEAPNPWVGHRMPLFAKGPVVLVVRSGVPPAALLGSR